MRCFTMLLMALILVPGQPVGAQSIYAKREAQASSAIKAELRELRSQIQREGQTFQVGYTTALDRTPEQLYGDRDISAKQERELNARQALFTRIMNPMIARLERNSKSCRPSAFSPGAVMARSFSWVQQGYMPAVKDQQTCGSCYAFATNTALEAIRAIADGRPPPRVDLSEQWAVSSCFMRRGCGGASTTQMAEFYLRRGALTEQAMPYINDNSPCKRIGGQFPVLLSYEVLNNANTLKSIPSVRQIKQWLAERGPLVARMWGTNSFEAYTRGVYEQTDYGAQYYGIHGNHAVVITGWDDRRQAWQVQNSWGTGWGEQGYVWMAYNKTSLGVRLWSYRTPKTCYGTLPAKMIEDANLAYARALSEAFGVQRPMKLIVPAR